MGNKAGSVEEAAEELMKIIPVFVRKIHAGMIGDMSLTPAQFFVLMLLEEKGQCRLGGISRELSIAPPTATGIVDRLERDGFVKRQHSKEDRRAVNISLTLKGEKLLAKMTAQKFERMKKVLGILKPEDRETHLRILKTLVEGMDHV